jgi:hypothetical protein
MRRAFVMLSVVFAIGCTDSPSHPAGTASPVGTQTPTKSPPPKPFKEPEPEIR